MYNLSKLTTGQYFKITFSSFFFTVISFSFNSDLALARLGGSPEPSLTVKSMRRAPQPQPQPQPQKEADKTYSVQDSYSDGKKIREWTFPNGIVFAISWRGAAQPDLTKLFGEYFQEYHSNMLNSQRHRRRGHQVLPSENIVVEKFGHQRDIRGFAYLRNVPLPEGFNLGELSNVEN